MPSAKVQSPECDSHRWMSTGATTLTIGNRKMFIDYLRHTHTQVQTHAHTHTERCEMHFMWSNIDENCMETFRFYLPNKWQIEKICKMNQTESSHAELAKTKPTVAK